MPVHSRCLALSTQLLCREIRVLLHVRASLLGQRLILIQDARRLRRHQLQVLAVAGFLPCGACRLQLGETR